MHSFPSISVCIIIFHHPSRLARPPHIFFPSGITQQAQFIIINKKAKPQRNRNSRHLFWHVSIYTIHQHRTNAIAAAESQPQPNFQQCLFFQWILPYIYMYYLFYIWFYGKRLNGYILPITSAITSIQVRFHFTFSPFSLSMFFFYTACFFFFFFVSDLSVCPCLFNCLNVSVYLSIYLSIYPSLSVFLYILFHISAYLQQIHFSFLFGVALEHIYGGNNVARLEN